VNTAFTPGALMVMDDHINLLGDNPLVGRTRRFGPRFPDMTEVYAPDGSATWPTRPRERPVCGVAHGVYVALRGPSYETPAEIRYLRTIGADAVGMSTVPEAIVRAAHGHRGARDLVHYEHGGRRASAAAPS
jgi:purine-nucleoside phosphorylase